MAVRDRARRDGAVGAEPVLDEELLARLGAELLRDRAGLDVRAAAGGEADQDAHRVIRIWLRQYRSRANANDRDEQ